MGNVLSTSRALNARPELVGELRDAGHAVELVDRPGIGEAEMAELARDRHALIVGVEPVTERVLEAAGDLRIVARPGVGYDQVDVATATRRGVAVTITPGANTESVADHTLALILACARRVTELDAAVHAGEWPRSVGLELRGRVLGILGIGAIGRAVALRAQAFGMRVVAYDPAPDPAYAAAHGVELVGLDELLGRADIVSLHAPHTPDTDGLVDQSLLERMRPHAILVNTARGGLVDEQAVADALAAGRLGAVGLDVLASEPPTASPLLHSERAVLTPHVAAYTGAALERMAGMAVAAVLDALAGRTPHGLVNPEVASGSRPITEGAQRP